MASFTGFRSPRSSRRGRHLCAPSSVSGPDGGCRGGVGSRLSCLLLKKMGHEAFIAHDGFDRSAGRWQRIWRAEAGRSWELFPLSPAFLPGGILSALPSYSWQCSGLTGWPQVQTKKLREPQGEKERESERSREERQRDMWWWWWGRGQRQTTEGKREERQSSIETEKGREEWREINTGKKREAGPERGTHRKGTARSPLQCKIRWDATLNE